MTDGRVHKSTCAYRLAHQLKKVSHACRRHFQRGLCAEISVKGRELFMSMLYNLRVVWTMVHQNSKHHLLYVQHLHCQVQIPSSAKTLRRSLCRKQLALMQRCYGALQMQMTCHINKKKGRQHKKFVDRADDVSCCGYLRKPGTNLEY